MSTAASPFTDQAQVAGPLYATAGRLARRSGALHRARVSGRHAGQVIAELAASAAFPDTHAGVVADVGCGRGTTTRLLTQRLPATRVVAVDLSAALLAAQPRILPAVRLVQADFRCLPLAASSCDVLVAAFCLYHSSSPGHAIRELARCLRPGGTMILATKSADSYQELDHLMAVAGIDPDAASRPSLYQAAHSGNLAVLASPYLDIQQVIHDTHRFDFASLASAAEYLATSPKYHLPASLTADPAALAAALRERIPDGTVTATSTVSYVVATRRATGTP